MRHFVAAGFGVGLLPRWLRGSDSGAGTMGALLGGAVAAALLPAPLWVHLAVTSVAIALSLWSPRPFLADDADPPWVAIDEVAGTMLAVTALSGWPWVTAWIVTRLADIFKFLPGVRGAEQLPATLGVTADDLVAGAYGLGAGWLLTLWL